MTHDPDRSKLSRRAFVAMASSTPLVATQCLADDPAKAEKRIYIAADDHTDYMWTADEQTYRDVFLETIDHYLALADQTDDRPAEFQSRWNCDGLFWFREYEQNKSLEQVARLVRRIKSGHISVPMTVLVSCYGAMPAEAAIRSLYYGGQVERKYDLRLPMAVAMENQTLPMGLGMIWSGSGVKYSWRGICGCASKIKDSASRRDHDVYWWVGKDGSRVLMKWYSLTKPINKNSYWNEAPGGYAEARFPEAAIKYADTDPDFLERNPHSVIGLFGQGWDDLKTIVPLDDADKSFPAVAQRMTTPNRQVIVSNELDYFDDMNATHGAALPEVSCSFGNEWELYSASLAEVSASVKRATEKLRAAEAMAAIVTPHRPDFAKDLEPARDQAWIAFGLYWEHDWTADGPISRERRAAWQRKIAAQITGYVDELNQRSAKLFGELIDKGEMQNAVFVFNSLSWMRTDYVDVSIDSAGAEVIDILSGKRVDSQVISQDGKRFVRFIASDIPALGFLVFDLRSSEAEIGASTITVRDGEIESSRDRIKVAPNGSISLWESIRLGKTLVRSRQTANDLEPAKGRVSIESAGSISTTIRIDVPRPLKRTTRITLFEKLDRIEIDNRLLESFAETHQWRFEFNLKQPRTVHEEVGAILRAATIKDGGDYADRNARTDWLTLNRFATLGDDEASVTLCNRDCLFFHLGEDIEQPMDSRSATIHVLAGGQVDGKKLGIPGQGGDQYFTQRFALHASSPDQTSISAMRSGMEFANPMTVGTVSGNEPVLSAGSSMLAVSGDEVIVSAFKPAESGKGTVVRLWNLSVNESKCVVSMTDPIKECTSVTHVETDIEPIEVTSGEVELTLPSGAMHTIRLGKL